MARTQRQYQEEYVSFLERVSDDLADVESLRDIDTWRTHVNEFVFGGSGIEGTSAFEQFVEDAFGFNSQALAAGGFTVDPNLNAFRDAVTGRFVSRDDILDFLRQFNIFGSFGDEGL